MGAAFIIIPALFGLKLPLKEAMATALLLKGVIMTIASIISIKNKLVAFGTAVPIIMVASVLCPSGQNHHRGGSLSHRPQDALGVDGVEGGKISLAKEFWDPRRYKIREPDSPILICVIYL